MRATWRHAHPGIDGFTGKLTSVNKSQWTRGIRHQGHRISRSSEEWVVPRSGADLTSSSMEAQWQWAVATITGAIRPSGGDSFWEIFCWWELRRLRYNLTVGSVGVLSSGVILVVAAIASELFNEPIGLPDPPILAVFGVIAYGIAANVCYTGGWLTEWVVRKVWRERAGAFGEISFVVGVVFSVLLTLVPAGLVLLALILRLLHAWWTRG
jgi:hypothetical protein